MKVHALSITDMVMFVNTVSGIPGLTELVSNGRVKTIVEIRRANLERLIAEAGGVPQLATRYDCNESFLRQMTGKHKGIGDKTALKMERVMQKPRGWMDQDHTPKLNPKDLDPKNGDRGWPMLEEALALLLIVGPMKDEVLTFARQKHEAAKALQSYLNTIKDPEKK